ncbi:unnamed protein product [Clonostachys rosea]|uniref:F-box domain-containing protein n=1 Tax=Bionectria ochroleuca TaxID=29856 RepID=A0ABY6UWQ5_BIOOC|nr:unnamed protein product [Clonostachys rosea]
MPTLSKLPGEVLTEILRRLPDWQSLMAASLTCQRLHSYIQSYQPIAADIVEAEVGESLLPYLIVASLGASLPRPFEKAWFLISHLYDKPEAIMVAYRAMSPRGILRMGHFHEYVCLLTHEWASDSWTHMNMHDKKIRALFKFRESRRPTMVDAEIKMSKAEKIRWARAIYRFEILVHFFRSGDVAQRTIAKLRHAYLAKHPAWELEQITAVIDFLDYRLLYATYETTAKYEDLAGKDAYDLRVGPHKPNRQTWGLSFLRRVELAKSIEDQRDILATGLEKGSAQPANSMQHYQEAVARNAAVPPQLYHFHTGEMEAMILAETNKGNVDVGPYTCWRQSHAALSGCNWASTRENQSLRMIAYVFWDQERIQTWDLKVLCGWLKDNDFIRPDPKDSKETTSLSKPTMTPRWARVLRDFRSI